MTSESNYWHRLARRRLSRRQVLRAATLGGGLLAAAAFGCGGRDGSAGRGTTGGRTVAEAGSVEAIQPGHYERHLAASQEELNPAQYAKRGGTLRFQYLDPPHFDAALSYSCTLYDTHDLVCNKVLRARLGPQADPFKLELEPDLAESWEVVAEDATEYVFSLRRNVRWQNVPPVNGREFTAEDIRAVWQRYAAGGVQKEVFSVVESMEATDRHTLRVRLKEPYVDFPQAVATYAYITPRELWENSDRIRTEIIGTGPFIRESWTPKEGAVFVRNPDYWELAPDGQPYPYLDRVEAVVVDDTAALRAGFRTRDWHFWSPPNSAEGQDMLSTAPDTVWLDLPQSRGGNVNGFTFNLNNPVFKDKRVRNAISMGIDRVGLDQLLYDGLNGGYSATALPWPFVYDELPTLEDQGPTFQYNPEEAKKLLQAAGHPNLEFELVHWYLRTTAEPVQNMLSQIGVKVNIRQVDNPTHVQIMTQRSFNEAVGVIWGPPQYGADGWIYPYYITGGGLNYNGVADPDLDRMLRAQRAETDPDRRRQILRDIDRHLNDQNYEIWWPQSWYRHMWPAFVKNFRQHGFAGTSQCYSCGQFRQVWLDQGGS